MKTFKQFTFLTIIATYFLIFIGGLVRVSGAGMGCPDWPKCFGSWIPPLNVQQLPANFNPASFNFILAWIEYVNRLAGVTIGLLILVTAILAVIHFRHNRKILLPSLFAALLVAFQGWHGSQVVASQLESIIVSVHMVIALVIISLLLYIYMQIYLIENKDFLSTVVFPRNSHVIIGSLWVVTIIQVLMGSNVRASLERVIRDYPLFTSSEWLTEIGFLDDFHAMLGGMIAMAAWLVGLYFLKKSKNLPDLVTWAVWSMMFILLLQIIIGLMLLVLGLPALMQLVHLWMASLLVGILLILYTVTKNVRL